MTDLYTRDDWSFLDFNLRWDLLPVKEGVRPACNLSFHIIENKYSVVGAMMQKYHLIRWLDASGLYYGWSDESDCYVSNEKQHLLDLKDEVITIDDFLNYPACCIKDHRKHEISILEFYDGKLPVEQVPLPRGPLLAREIEIAKEKGDFDPAINYLPHMPCSAYCRDSIELGHRMKAAFDSCCSTTGQQLFDYFEASREQFRKSTPETWQEFLIKRKKFLEENKR